MKEKVEDVAEGEEEKVTFLSEDNSTTENIKKSSLWHVTPHQGCTTRLFPWTQVEGNNYLVFGHYKRGENVSFPQHCLLGPDYVCSFLTTFLILLANGYWLIISLQGQLHWALLFIGIALGFGLLSSYSLTAYTDPGIVKRKNENQSDKIERVELGEQYGYTRTGQSVCRICNVRRENSTRHCYDCDACILEHDHHCPWTGHCIGKYNIQYFYAFLIFLFADLVYVIFSGAVALASQL